MARRIRDAELESRTAREKLAVRRKPYFKQVTGELYIGYRRNRTGGVWCVRRYEGDGNYSLETFATADDMADANGKDVLDFWQAQDHIRDLHKKAGEPKKPITVEDAPSLAIEEGQRTKVP